MKIYVVLYRRYDDAEVVGVRLTEQLAQDELVRPLGEKGQNCSVEVFDTSYAPPDNLLPPAPRRIFGYVAEIQLRDGIFLRYQARYAGERVANRIDPPDTVYGVGRTKAAALAAAQFLRTRYMADPAGTMMRLRQL